MSTYQIDGPECSNQAFRTTDLAFASYLLASSKLRFAGCERPSGSHGLVEFAFDDPQEQGESLKTEFQGRAECSAVGLFDAQRRLRRMVDEVLGRREGAR